jgi:hypothetical protein
MALADDRSHRGSQPGHRLAPAHERLPHRRPREPRPRGGLRVACTHPVGRPFPDPLVREMLRAFGIVTCPECGQALRILGRRRR